MGQGNNASWPVGGATRQSGGNWVGRFEKPEDWSIWASMYSSNLELGQLITVGDAILKWTAAGVKFVDAAFATQADLDSFCSKIGTPIATGSTAMVAGVQYTYGAAGWASSEYGPIYNGTTLPLPTSGERCRIRVANPAVPHGWSWLEWTGMFWAPPSGELIAWYASDTYLAQATPGVQTLYKAWQSPDIIPDYMLADGGVITINASANVKNAAGVTGVHLMAGVSGSDPTSTEAATYPIGIREFIPQPGGSGFIATIPGWSQRVGNVMRASVWGVNAGSLSQASGITEVTSNGRACVFAPGSMRAYVKVVTKSASDIVTVNMIQVKAGF